MIKETRIAVDAMGGDGGPKIIMPSIKDFILENEDISVKIYGDENILSNYLKIFNDDTISRIEIIHSDEKVLSTDSPSHALRHKKKSSMSMAIQSVKDGKTQACISAGNTGALMAISRFILGTLDGIDRPAIESMLPSLSGHTHVLDLGANVDCKAEHLYQFAVMGSVLSMILDEKDNPKVGLLNVGEETIKGNPQVKDAHNLLKSSKLNYVGFVEGDDIFCGNIDVIVCDGFTGNIVLKQAEGIFSIMEKRGILDDYFKRFNYENYGGTPILGIRGNVIIGHGISNDIAIKNMLLHSYEVASSGLAKKIKKAFK